ncbi:MAG: metalloregulator ArsR/SmtB family transcription factor [Planctomycetota bacterium]|nr:metalloregulator ArsR/SmtB family transcription factor [Planctomycetota bacterium]
MKTAQAVTALAAIAQESRLKVFRLLVVAGAEGLAAGEIAEQLAIPPATLTFHLKELVHAGLIAPQRFGRSIRYTLVVNTMRELMQFLTEDCCQGRPELCDSSGSSCCGEKKKRSKQTAVR